MSLLKKVETGKKFKPLNLLVYGVEGIGKSTFASGAPNPIFVGAEENDELEIARFPRVNSWNEFIGYLQTLVNEEHDFQTVVVDTIDSVETILQKEIVNEDKADSMAKACGGYGAAYQKQMDKFVEVRRLLARLRDEKNMNVIVLAHCEKVKFFDPMSSVEFDTFQMKLHKHSAPLFKDWASCVLFANYANYKTKNDSGRELAVSTGERKIYTEKRPGHDAKNRFNLPYEMNFKWDEFVEKVREFYK